MEWSNMVKNKTACFSGHRPTRLPKGQALRRLEERLYEEIEEAIFDEFDTFLFGACYGFDLLAARQVLLHKRFKNIRLVAIVPFEGQAEKWDEALRGEYHSILAQCDEVITLHKNYRREYYLARNRYMVDRSALLICYYDGGRGSTGQTVFYAKEKGLEIINLYE